MNVPTEARLMIRPKVLVIAVPFDPSLAQKSKEKLKEREKNNDHI